jgi:hypothetical protein
MKFLIHYDHASFNTISQRSLEIECEGDGTKDNPIIIEPSELLPRAFKIVRSNLYVIIRNCENSIILNKVQNITIESCNLRGIIVTGSSNVTVKDTKIRRSLYIAASFNVIVEDCELSKIEFFNSRNNVIRNCVITKRIELSESEDNIIQNNYYPDNNLEKRIIQKSKKFSIKPMAFTYLTWIISLIALFVMFLIGPSVVMGVILGLVLVLFVVLEFTIMKFLRKKLRNMGKELDNKENIN